MRNWWALLCVGLGAIALAVWGTTPPAPRGLDAPASDFAAGRAMTDVRVIARARRTRAAARRTSAGAPICSSG